MDAAREKELEKYGMEADPATEEEEEEEIHLRSSTQTNKQAEIEEPMAEEPKVLFTGTAAEDSEPAQEEPAVEEPAQEIPKAVEDEGDQQGKEEAPMEADDEGENAEGKYQRERKRKGKLPARQVRKRARKANPNVVIQEPAQVPPKNTASESEDEEVEEEESTRKLYSMSDETPVIELEVSLVDSSDELERVSFGRIYI